uniref:topoisomerase DNA-binding C4 zinc finger domain-containing protein n=1 Tax=Megasphaera micronuciformis TaxID=187326 RepID=UPI004024DE78
ASTLLAAMKEIYKYVKDDGLKKKLKEVQGIGTEATRATIINELIGRKFLYEEGKKKYLCPADSAYILIDALPDELAYPDETAIWEERLHLMSIGKDDLQSFLKDQVEFLRTLIQKAGQGVVKTPVEGKRCPRCGSVMIKRAGKYGEFYGCTSYPKCKHTEQIIPKAVDESTDYICPRCKTGRFVRMDGPYGPYWLCNHPGCKTKCADVKGRPSIYQK